MLLAQAETVKDLSGLIPQEVVPFLCFVLAASWVVLVVLWRAREAERRELINFLRGVKGDTDGDGKPG